MEDLDLPTQGIPPDLLDGLGKACHLEIGQQLPDDGLAPGRRGHLDGMDDRQIQRWVAFLLADRRQDADPLGADVEGDLLDLVAVDPDGDRMRPGTRSLEHLGLDRVVAAAGEPVDDGAHDEVGAKLAGQAVELIYVALAVADMHAAPRLTQQRDGLPQVLEPADALFGFDQDPRRIDLPLELGCAPELVSVPELDGGKAERKARPRSRPGMSA
ncbi:hypothetical protein [Rubellimicrobium aerolatum]|uniref:Uncharacterized protein n=1 Tax=Rubellimicrobium aerolatum TaxID=490979 RepID=A0ABW0SHJ0_9RHOB|nr:hypothetical protein [Rubellimicrobium aerolatum]MBP1807775.1 hypothetical protein [Rubellimicrobium aerolatum]